MDDDAQGVLSLPFPQDQGALPLVPARMVNEYVYCPRLAYLEWVQGEWADSGDTVEGRYRHRRVDRPGGDLPAPEEMGAGEQVHARSITLSSVRLGLIARLDLVEAEGGIVTPVDYKRGKRPHVARGAYDPERVQLCVQGLMLEEHGYDCPEGVIYFVESRERVRVPFDPELREMTLAAVDGLRLIASGGRLPPPLVDSPKCPACSLVGICLPDEVNFMRRMNEPPRPLVVARDDALPLIVQAFRARITRNEETLEVRVEDALQATARLIDVSQVVLMGNVSVTTPALHELMQREIPVTWHSYGGWFMGHTVGVGHKNVELRTAQYRASFDERICLQVARGLVRAKIQNCRTLMRRNWRGGGNPEPPLDELRRFADDAMRAKDMGELLGVEGIAARHYFGGFHQMIKDGGDPACAAFDFENRNRRPPQDPVNALLSFAYAMLVRTWTVTLTAVGFDVYRGLFHQPRYGRPALSLDMMEPFRPLIADSCVLQAINNGEIRLADFVCAAGGVALTSAGRKRFIATFERRLGREVTHPLFGYKVSYRRLIEIQARLLGRFLLGDIPEYPNFTTR